MTRSILKGRLSSRVGRSCSRLRAEPRPRSLGSGCALACIEASVTIGDADTWTFVVTIRESAEGFKGYEGRHVCARGAKRACGSSFQGTGRSAFFGQSGDFGFGPHAGREEKKSEDLTDKLSLWAAPLVGGARCVSCISSWRCAAQRHLSVPKIHPPCTYRSHLSRMSPCARGDAVGVASSVPCDTRRVAAGPAVGESDPVDTSRSQAGLASGDERTAARTAPSLHDQAGGGGTQSSDFQRQIGCSVSRSGGMGSAFAPSTFCASHIGCDT